MVGISESSKQELYELLEKYNLLEYSELIAKHAEGHIYITTAGEDKYERVGNSRIGGVPDFPPSINWQQSDAGYMSFVAQINLSEIPKLPFSPLPETGLLYFFYADYPISNGKDQHSVVYYDGEFSHLKKSEQPPIEEFACEPDWSVYKPCRVRMEDSFSLPDQINEVRKIFEERIDTNSEEFEKIVTQWNLLTEELYERKMNVADWESEISKILGKPHFIHYRLMTDAQLVREGKSTYSWDGDVADENEVEKWLLLFELSSHNEARMSWSDMGFLDFVIHKDDLSKLDFTKTYCAIAGG